MRNIARLGLAVLVAAGAGAIAAEATESQPTRPPLVEAVHLPSATDTLSVADGLPVVGTSQSPSGSSCRVLDPATLRVLRTVPSCSSTLAQRHRHVVVRPGRCLCYEIRVSVRNPVTRKVTVGPVLMTDGSWAWGHGGVVEGDGTIWIWGASGTLLEVSARTGRAEHRYSVAAGDDPYMAVNDDGFWMTPSPWDGTSCSTACDLWHVAPGSDRLVVARRLGTRTQWFLASAHSVFLDVLTPAPGGWTQAVWRLDGPDAHVAYETRATLLPPPSFGGTGYVVEGTAQLGLFTLTQLGKGATPTGIGDCKTSAPERIVRIDPATGRQSYVATLPERDAGRYLGCDLEEGQAAFTDGALYLLSDPVNYGYGYRELVRVSATPG